MILQNDKDLLLLYPKIILMFSIMSYSKNKSSILHV